MTAADDVAVRQAAQGFRRAIDELKSDLVSVSFELFPYGSCGDVAVLLGQYLEDSGLGEWTYRSGFGTAPRGSHGWIELDGLIVDITADQFSEIDEAVIVTRDVSWHVQFRAIGDAHLANLAGYTGLSGFKETLRGDYELLRARADAHAPDHG